MGNHWQELKDRIKAVGVTSQQQAGRELGRRMMSMLDSGAAQIGFAAFPGTADATATRGPLKGLQNAQVGCPCVHWSPGRPGELADPNRRLLLIRRMYQLKTQEDFDVCVGADVAD